jgi:crotonobetainyl-CoA:carnitine CoA-transferase CaiB-like acyl-CoA transferase
MSDAPKDQKGPLAGIRILDLTSVVFGAYATQMLGDLGADIIKVESPQVPGENGGDILRWAGHPPKGAPDDLGPLYMTINRNKRSIALDLASPEGRSALLEVLEDCQVFVASVRADGLARLGLAYEDLKAARPDLIYVHGSGYGAGGPYAGEPAYDDLIQSASGLADLLPRTDGDPRPRLLPSLIADKVSGLFMSQAILAALFHRERTGEGQFVEVPMFECVTSFNLAEHLYGHVYDPPTGPYGYTRVANPSRKPFKTLDGYIGLLPYSNRQWSQFFEIAGWTETHSKDVRFNTPRARSLNAAVLYAQMEEVTAQRTTKDWLDLLKPLGIPVTPTNRLDDLLEDPHLVAVGFFETQIHPKAGPWRAMRPPLNFSATPASIRRHPPTLGEHTEEVLDEARARRSARSKASS